MISSEGKNCWCTTTADKAAFLIDGADYYEAFVLAVRQARHTVYITGWDIDSRLLLNRRNMISGDIPPLGEFLNQTAKDKKSLNIYILAWDFPLMFLRERQWLPQVHLGWKTHRHIHFNLDGEHPIGASHHEKIVVVDDSIAFCGGLDLTKNRWDTSEHLVDDPRRCDPEGNRFTPYHDVQVAVSGETARALGMRFRDRWQKATGEVLPIPPEGGAEWPHKKR